MDSLGLKLHKLMISHHLTQKTLANKIGVTQKTVSRIINNKSDPSYKVMQKLIELFNLDMSFFDDDYELTPIINEPESTYSSIPLIDFSYLEKRLREMDMKINALSEEIKNKEIINN